MINLKLLITNIVVMGLVVAHETQAMESSQASQQDVEQKVDHIAQQQYNLPSSRLSEDVLAAIFVHLDPPELVAASKVSSAWYKLAVRVMEANLRKWAAPLSEKPSLEEITAKYPKMSYYNVCPKFPNGKSIASFSVSLRTADQENAYKRAFIFDNKTWFLDKNIYQGLRNHIHAKAIIMMGGSEEDTIIANEKRADRLGKIEFVRTEFVNDHQGKRLRCYYNHLHTVKYAENYLEFPFVITTFLDK